MGALELYKQVFRLMQRQDEFANGTITGPTIVDMNPDKYYQLTLTGESWDGKKITVIQLIQSNMRKIYFTIDIEVDPSSVPSDIRSGSEIISPYTDKKNDYGRYQYYSGSHNLEYSSVYTVYDIDNDPNEEAAHLYTFVLSLLFLLL